MSTEFAAIEGMPGSPSRDSTIETPPTTWSGDYFAIPSPEHSYIIVEKESKQVITIKEGGDVHLQDFGDREADSIRWMCVERNGYFGFYNSRFGVYLGHDIWNNIVAKAQALNLWELMTPRKHPKGGYQLLMPDGQTHLKVLKTAKNGTSLVCIDHGETLWEFIRI